MAATSKEEIDSLLSAFDQIYENFKSGIKEIQVLKSNWNAENKKREAIESTCNSLKQENERLRKMYTGSLNNLAEKELQRLREEQINKEDEHKKAMELLKKDYEAKVGELEDQIRMQGDLKFAISNGDFDRIKRNADQEIGSHLMFVYVMVLALWIRYSLARNAQGLMYDVFWLAIIRFLVLVLILECYLVNAYAAS